jgi:hypothetical protein|tara:strand:+ start:2890 stop:3129 length:240 start_codon:yes stop_codon:yes gene_type:complete
MGEIKKRISLCLILLTIPFLSNCANTQNKKYMKDNDVKGWVPYFLSGGNQQYAPSKYNPDMDKPEVKLLEYDFERRFKD